MSTGRFVREIRRAVSEAGGVLVGLTTGKHLKVTIDFGCGPRTVTCSLSPSDVNAIKNVRRDIDKIKNGVR